MIRKEQLANCRLDDFTRGEINAEYIQKRNGILKRIYNIQLTSRGSFHIELGNHMHGMFYINATYINAYLKADRDIVCRTWTFNEAMSADGIDSKVKEIYDFVKEADRVEEKLEKEND